MMNCFSFILVGSTNLDFFESAQHVGFHHYQLGNTVYLHSITKSYQIQPAATSWPSGNGSKLIPDFGNLGSGFIKEFCWEGTASHPCGISFENSEYILYFVWSYSQTGTGSGGSCIGRGHKWICSEIDIQ